MVLAECISGITKQTKHSNDDLSFDKKNIKITFIKTTTQKNLKSIFGCRLFHQLWFSSSSSKKEFNAITYDEVQLPCVTFSVHNEDK